ncbi:MAG: hypothetical protein JWQ36_2047 [Enterovirga sp.]|jgi:hypothetical protein|nr:hypothetical protein [Enterovirga sp.]
MPNHLWPRAALAVLLFGLLGAGPAEAADPRDGVRAGGPRVVRERTIVEHEHDGAWGRPPRPLGRPVTGGPGYVGSDYGLGKPAFTGLGSRPDWGFSE